MTGRKKNERDIEQPTDPYRRACSCCDKEKTCFLFSIKGQRKLLCNQCYKNLMNKGACNHEKEIQAGQEEDAYQ